MIITYFDVNPSCIFLVNLYCFLGINPKGDICFPALKQDFEHKSELSDRV